ncbi:MAG: hypothetical protein WC607_03110 [Candidatus Micrarchaeia archaeon]
MKPVLFLLFACTLVAGYCLDSDNGLNYDYYGYAQGNQTTLNDSCLDAQVLNEAYCAASAPAYYQEYCRQGCIQGECVTRAPVQASPFIDEDYLAKSLADDPVGEIAVFIVAVVLLIGVLAFYSDRG